MQLQFLNIAQLTFPPRWYCTSDLLLSSLFILNMAIFSFMFLLVVYFYKYNLQIQYPCFQYPCFQYPCFQFPCFQYPCFQYPCFQFPCFQYPCFQYPCFQYPCFQFPCFQFPCFKFPCFQFLSMFWVELITHFMSILTGGFLYHDFHLDCLAVCYGCWVLQTSFYCSGGLFMMLLFYYTPIICSIDVSMSVNGSTLGK